MQDEMKGAVLKDFKQLFDLRLNNDNIEADIELVLNKVKEVGEYVVTKEGERSTNNGENDIGKWVNFPSTTGAGCEKKIAKYFEENIVSKVQHLFKASTRMGWSGDHADTPVTNDYCDRKPDLVILRGDAPPVGPDRTWWHIMGTLEVKKDETLFEEALGQLIECARLIVSTQPNRRFVLDAILCGPLMWLVYFDRSGILISIPFNVHDHPRKFLRVVVGLLYLNDENRGFDPTVVFDTEKTGTIAIGGINYPFTNVRYVEGVLRGRATACYDVKKDDEKHLIKDSWVDVSRIEKEELIMKEVHDQKEDKYQDLKKHVPDVVASEVVTIHGENDSTALLRPNFIRTSVDSTDLSAKKYTYAWINPEHSRIEIREHRRIMMKPVARRLEDFSCLAEFVQAFIDSARCTFYLAS